MGYPFDFLKTKDIETIFSPPNNKIVLQFKKILNDDKDPLCFTRKLICGNCKLLDPKNEKAAAFDILMPVNNTHDILFIYKKT